MERTEKLTPKQEDKAEEEMFMGSETPQGVLPET
jgi:hypothetical protein